jgi:hypothetical protein
MILTFKNNFTIRKRECEIQAEELCVGPHRKTIKVSTKIKRAMTFSGPSVAPFNIQTVLHPPISDDPFSQPCPLIPSFHESGKDMIRRISTHTVLEPNLACRYN